MDDWMIDKLDNINCIDSDNSLPDPTSISPSSKQLTFYYRHRDKINRARRTHYKITHNRDKCKAKKQKPNDRDRLSLYNQINAINQSLNRCKTDRDGKKKVILELNDLLNLAYDQIAPNLDYSQIHRTTTTRNFARPFLAFQIAGNWEQFFWQIESEFKDAYSKRQLRRALNDLLQLKWIVRLGRGDMTRYRANPFLEALTDVNRNWLMLCYYTQFDIDFFDLLNIPLINAQKEKIVDAKVSFHEYKGKHAQWVQIFFEGFVTIKLTAQDGSFFRSHLPVNRHAGSKITGYNPETKKPLINQIGNYHHTIPLKWELFEVKESVEFSRKGRKSRRAKVVEKYIYVHFDNSIKLLCYDKIDNEFGRYGYRVFGKPFEELLKNIWSKKNYNCQYVEVSDFEVLQQMFTYRFVDGKRKAELFDALGIHYAKTKKAPYAN
jgi:hypothetical protein